jgi:hypothetical protein
VDPTQTLIQVYERAWLEILERLATKAAAGQSTAYEQALLADITEILTQLDADTRNWIEQELPKIYLNGMSDAVRQLIDAGAISSGFTASLTGINQSAVQILAANLYGDLSDANSLVGRRIDDLFRQAGIQAVTTKVSTGQTIPQAQKNLRQLLVDQGVSAFVDSAGRNWSLDTYAAMVTRTTSAEATNRGTLNQLSGLGYDLVAITEHFPTCPICAPYQGRIYSISGKDERFPALFGTAFSVAYATIHPNCAHRLRPIVWELLTAAEQRDALDMASRSFDVDPRSERERRLYENGQVKKRILRADREQWQRYRTILPNDAPSTLAGFRRMKAANSPRYQELRQLYREARRQIA